MNHGLSSGFKAYILSSAQGSLPKAVTIQISSKPNVALKKQNYTY